MPASVTIPDGQASVGFTLTAVDDAVVDGTQTVTISATAGGVAPGSDQLDVADDELPTLTLTLAEANISENGGMSLATVSRKADTARNLLVYDT